MAKYLVETYYTCTFKVNHYLDDINETELKNLEKRDDGKFEVLDVKLDNRKTKSLDPNNKMISISLRKRIKSKLNFNLKLIDYKRIDPEYKNLKYKKILNFLNKMDTTKSDIALYKNNKILESGTSNLLFIKKNKIYSQINNFYRVTT